MRRWDDLRFVLALSRHGTMAAAAESLSINTATVSRRIAKISDDIGTTLFVRRGSDWIPTPAAMNMVKVAASIEEKILDAHIDKPAVTEEMRDFKIAIETEVMLDAVSTYIPEFVQKNPNIRLSLVETEKSLALGEADIAIGFDEPTSGRLIRFNAGEIFFGTFCRREYKNEIIGFIDNSVDKEKCKYYKRLCEIFEAPHVITKGLLFSVDLIRNAPFCTCLPLGLANRFDELVPFEDAPMVMGYDVWVSYHESRRLDPGIQLIKNFIRECFRRDT